ncbi:hypothetical protein Bca52824_075710 [Brassica carinata]|uniref:Uncharacterized protein n=1 Tax=Brassica carinata TaxID=52824 RepID=A0A8X7TYA3_BRACI|nr:hypothetical protein Bca52824_075710 [Brassica carinata]
MKTYVKTETFETRRKRRASCEFRIFLTSPWLEAISTVTVHFAATSGNSITFKSLKLLAMGFAEYEEAKGRR